MYEYSVYSEPVINVGVASQDEHILLGMKNGISNGYGMAVIKGQHTTNQVLYWTLQKCNRLGGGGGSNVISHWRLSVSYTFFLRTSKLWSSQTVLIVFSKFSHLSLILFLICSYFKYIKILKKM